jgi:cysteine protease ATG4
MSKNLRNHSGRPSSSHYFIGSQGSDFFYLDPHQTRPALPVRKDLKDYTEEEIGSCHTRRLRRINVREMDPSMLIGFLVRNEAEWHAWRQHVSETPGKAIIHVMDKEPPQAGGSSTERESAIDEVETFDTEDDEM